jgi:hypothetical protein
MGFDSSLLSSSSLIIYEIILPPELKKAPLKHPRLRNEKRSHSPALLINNS